MLLQFAVENFKSFRDRAVLSMLAAPHLPSPPGGTYEVEGVGRVLKVAAIYGANASGKSTLVEAWHALVHIVVIGAPLKPRGGFLELPVVPFRGSGSLSGATRFDATFRAGEDVWRYCIVADPVRVHEEQLERQVSGAFVTVFTRTSGVEGRVRVRWGAGLPSVDAERQVFYRVLGEGTRPEQSVMAELGLRAAHELEVALVPFSIDVLPIEDLEANDGFADENTDVIERTVEDREFKESLGQWLGELGTGVHEVEVSHENPERERRLQRGGGDESSEGAFLVYKSGSAEFERDEISAGTRRVVALSIAWVGGFPDDVPLFIDELDQSLHTSLTRRLIEQAIDRCRAGAQLVFTVHDTNLLDAGLLGADGIWFVQKDHEGASHLYSLAEFDPTDLEALTDHLEDGYLEGRFGALPFFGDPRKLGWAAS